MYCFAYPLQDTHVLSVTINLGRIDPVTRELLPESLSEDVPWPLEVVGWDGHKVRYNHPAKTMILYESAKLAHGRPYRLPEGGGNHLGVFGHFCPENIPEWFSSHGGTWEDLSAQARRVVPAHTKSARYRSAPTEEPARPRYSEYILRKEDYEGKANPEDYGGGRGANAGSFGVTFTNESPVDLMVLWVGPEHGYVYQGLTTPGASTTVESHHGHHFLFAEPYPGFDPFDTSFGDPVNAPPLVRGGRYECEVEVQKGQSLYVCGGGHDEL